MSACELYLIIVDDMIIGSIHMEDDMITNIDINGDFFVNIKTRLMRELLYELGINQIDLICNPNCFDYYSKLGFEVHDSSTNTSTDTTTDRKVLLRYSI